MENNKMLKEKEKKMSLPSGGKALGTIIKIKICQSTSTSTLFVDLREAI